MPDLGRDGVQDRTTGDEQVGRDVGLFVDLGAEAPAGCGGAGIGHGLIVARMRRPAGFPWPGPAPILGPMRRAEADALVGASRDEVWELYDDIAGMPRWVPSVQEIRYVSGPARVGTIYRERTRVAGVPGTTGWEITEHRRPVRQVHVSTGESLDRRRVVTFEARGSGTWVHQVVEVRSSLWGPVAWLHELLAVFPAGWVVRSTVAGAKRAFEGNPRR